MYNKLIYLPDLLFPTVADYDDGLNIDHLVFVIHFAVRLDDNVDPIMANDPYIQ